MIDRRSIILSPFILAAFGLVREAFALPGERPRVVATFSILADIARNVAGERAEIVALVGPDGDMHTYAPTPADAKQIAGASLILMNGLYFEGFLDRLVKASGKKVPVVSLSEGIKPLPSEHERDDHKHEHGRKDDHGSDAHNHDHDGVDPHVWHDVGNAKLYVEAIRTALTVLDPPGGETYEQNARRYLSELDALDREIRSTVAAIPLENRTVITSHDAFAYFEAAYGIRFLAVQGLSTDSEASAKDVAAIIARIRQGNIRAIFVEAMADPRLVERIARETGIRVGGRLYADALSTSDGPAPTYIAMMRHNMKTLVTALVA